MDRIGGYLRGNQKVSVKLSTLRSKVSFYYELC